jgi:uncharacterized protein (DUF924 family)
MNNSVFNTRVLNFWFPNTEYHRWWFIPYEGLDRTIYDEWYGIMKFTYENFDINNYSNPNDMIQHIILLDQFSRNINRIIPIDITSYTIKALLLSQLWIDRNYHITEPIHYTVFALMPFRHMQQNDIVLKKLQEIETYDHTINNNNIYVRFKQTTLRKIKLTP